MKVHVRSEREVTADDIVREANTIWKKVKSQDIDIRDVDATENYTNQLRKEHPEFAKAYPIVLRYMCQMREYKGSALKKYLQKIQAKPYTNEEEYLESQVDYVEILYKATHNKWNRTEIVNLRKNIRNILTTEHKDFKKKIKRIDEDVTRENELYKQKNKYELREYLSDIISSGEDPGNIAIRTETNIVTGDEVNVDSLIAELHNTDNADTDVISTDELF